MRRVWIIGVLLLISTGAWAQSMAIPKVSVGIDAATNPQDVSLSLQILFMLTVLSLAPALLIMVSSFTRIVIVLSFIRTALGLQQVPPNQVLIGLALFLTFFTMAPSIDRINNQALQPYLQKSIGYEVALERAQAPLREFMYKQTREVDLALFVHLSRMPRPQTQADVPTSVLIPAFLISELRTAFTMGFMILVPFVVIDLVVGVMLMALGMMMLPPALVSLPMKVMLFVLVDGWHLITRSVIESFR